MGRVVRDGSESEKVKRRKKEKENNENCEKMKTTDGWLKRKMRSKEVARAKGARANAAYVHRSACV